VRRASSTCGIQLNEGDAAHHSASTIDTHVTCAVDTNGSCCFPNSFFRRLNSRKNTAESQGLKMSRWSGGRVGKARVSIHI
jgi:hypothetical protein